MSVEHIEPADLRAVYEDLVMISDVALLFGVKQETVKRWYERRESTKFPLELTTVGASDYKLFSYKQVSEWYKVWTATRRPR